MRTCIGLRLFTHVRPHTYLIGIPNNCAACHSALMVKMEKRQMITVYLFFAFCGVAIVEIRGDLADFGLRGIFQRRIQQGEYHNLLHEMSLNDTESHFRYLRMSLSTFDDLLLKVRPYVVVSIAVP